MPENITIELTINLLLGLECFYFTGIKIIDSCDFMGAKIKAKVILGMFPLEILLFEKK